MTVKDLKELLEEFDESLEVGVPDFFGEIQDIDSLEIDEIHGYVRIGI